MRAEPERHNPFARTDHAQGYDAWYETPLGAAMDRAQKRLVWSLAQPAPVESALDVGTGTGNYACELAQRGLHVVGRDPSEAMLAVAREKPCGVTWELGVAESLQYDDGQFDLVLSVTALEFMQDPERALAEMVRVCKPGGRVVIGTLNATSPWGALYAEAAADPASPFYGANLHTPERFVALLARWGDGRWKSVRWNSAGFMPLSGHYLAWASLIESWGRRFRKQRGALLVGRIDR